MPGSWIMILSFFFFSICRENGGCVLFLDEADAFLSKRMLGNIMQNNLISGKSFLKLVVRHILNKC